MHTYATYCPFNSVFGSSQCCPRSNPTKQNSFGVNSEGKVVSTIYSYELEMAVFAEITQR